MRQQTDAPAGRNSLTTLCRTKMIVNVLASFVALSTAALVQAAPISGGQVDDWVWAELSTTGSFVPRTFDTEALSLSTSGSEQQGTGTALAAASLADGYLKASVSAATGGCCLAGQAGVRVGLGTKINLFGPSDVAGIVAVTMTLTGAYAGPGDFSQIQANSGPGLVGPSVGFEAGDLDIRGFFELRDSSVHGPSTDCINCTFVSGDYFPITVTTYLPFDPGSTFVRYAANILFETSAFIDGSSFIDAFNTALFSIELPVGFTHTSVLSFSQPAAVPQPATVVLLITGLAGASISIRSTRRRLRRRASSGATATP